MAATRQANTRNISVFFIVVVLDVEVNTISGPEFWNFDKRPDLLFRKQLIEDVRARCFIFAAPLVVPVVTGMRLKKEKSP